MECEGWWQENEMQDEKKKGGVLFYWVDMWDGLENVGRRMEGFKRKSEP